MNPLQSPPETEIAFSDQRWQKWLWDIYMILSGKANNSSLVPSLHIFSNIHGLKVGLTAVQVVATATPTIILHNVVVIDQDAAFNVATGIWKPSKKGKYMTVANVTWPAPTVNNKQVSVAIFKNGVQEIGAAFDTGGSATGMSAIVTGIVEMNGSSDYAASYCFHTFGVGSSPMQLVANTYFHAYWIGE